MKKHVANEHALLDFSAAADVVVEKIEADLSGAAAARVVSRPAQTSIDAQKEMQQVALVFLEDPLARRLAVAWTTCGGDESRWLEAAGLPMHHSEGLRQCRALKVNGICRAGGVTDPLALAYIKTIIARPLRQQKKEKP